jgi:ParB/RepB/Spo0J family partition protein
MTTTAIPKTDSFKIVERSLIALSPTNPRKFINPVSLEELAESIKNVGIIEPLVVRLSKLGNYELIAGERRWRAAEIARLTEIPIVVKDLTNEQVLDMQIEENLHREDLAPMDEARGYKFFMDKAKLTVQELALRLGKSEKFILERLKLNELSKEAIKDLDEGVLPLRHALELVKYDHSTQTKILKDAMNQDGKERYVDSFHRFKERIERDIHSLLSRAPFPLDATNLRKDGLTCVACPSRAGNNPTLFDHPDAKTDKCLNRECFEKKTVEFVHVTRDSISKKHAAESNKKGYLAPVIQSMYYGEKSPFKQPTFSDYSDDVKIITGKSCGHAEPAIHGKGNNIGKVVQICRKKSCVTHFGKAKTVNTPSTEAVLDEKRQRKEEIIDVKVREGVRRKVLRMCAADFAGGPDVNLRFKNVSIGTEHDLLAHAIGTLWRTCDEKDFSLVIQPVMQSIIPAGKKLLGRWEFASAWDPSKKHHDDYAKELFDANELRALLFLFTHCSSGSMYSGFYRTQKRIIELAKTFGLDYRLLDAEERVKISSKKNKPAYEAYLQAVKNGNVTATIPRLLSTNYSKSKSDDALLVPATTKSKGATK